ncbi:MAG: hypothetical protein Q8J74_00745 [Candidatus Didemnitutus sp.]|nr:hypothetical protein [Candidatus Didemnitutus sp.]
MKTILRSLCFATLAVGLSAAEPRVEFWQSLQALCGQAFEGRMVEGTAASDAAFRDQTMIMHVRQCSADEIRIPFFVGENRSRTWVLTRSTQGLRLKHDHRHEDGAEDAVTQYGGDTADAGTVTTQEFLADEFTGTLIPAAKTNIWTMQIENGKLFAYALRRDAENRRFRVEFDLTKPVAPPPPPWGSEDK